MNRIAWNVLIRMTALTLVLAVAGLPACSDNGEPNGNAVLIIAAQGGSVAMDGDETGISIPANALTTDTEISISYGSLSDFGVLDNGLPRVLVMEPAGTTLQTPATVLLDPGSVIGTDKVVSVRQWMDGGWYGTQEATVVSGYGLLPGAPGHRGEGHARRPHGHYLGLCPALVHRAAPGGHHL